VVRCGAKRVGYVRAKVPGSVRTHTVISDGKLDSRPVPFWSCRRRHGTRFRYGSASYRSYRSYLAALTSARCGGNSDAFYCCQWQVNSMRSLCPCSLARPAARRTVLDLTVRSFIDARRIHCQASILSSSGSGSGTARGIVHLSPPSSQCCESHFRRLPCRGSGVCAAVGSTFDTRFMTGWAVARERLSKVTRRLLINTNNNI